MAFGGGAQQVKKGALSKIGSVAKSKEGQAAIGAMTKAAGMALAARKNKKKANEQQKRIMEKRGTMPKIRPTNI
jgi:hypothetical protein